MSFIKEVQDLKSENYETALREIKTNKWGDVLMDRASLALQILSDSKESSYNWEDLGSIPGSGISPKEGLATHPRILAWRIHGQRSLVGYNPWGSQRVRHA